VRVQLSSERSLNGNRNSVIRVADDCRLGQSLATLSPLPDQRMISYFMPNFLGTGGMGLDKACLQLTGPVTRPEATDIPDAEWPLPVFECK